MRSLAPDLSLEKSLNQVAVANPLTKGRAQIRAGASLLLLLAVFALPARARAGCGHDEMSPATAHQLAQYLDPIVSGPSGPVQGHSTSMPPRGLPRPCSGPSCSNKNSVPPAAPQVSEPRYSETWACLDPVEPPPALPSTLLDAAAHSLGSSGSPLSIFHPPR